MCASLKTLVCLLKRVATKCSFELNHFSLEMHLIWHHLENLGFSHNISVINQLMHYFFKNLFITKWILQEIYFSCHYSAMNCLNFREYTTHPCAFLASMIRRKIMLAMYLLAFIPNPFQKRQRIVFKTNMGVPWCY